MQQNLYARTQGNIFRLNGSLARQMFNKKGLKAVSYILQVKALEYLLSFQISNRSSIDPQTLFLRA